VSRLRKLFGSPATRPVGPGARLGVVALDAQLLPSAVFTDNPGNHAVSVRTANLEQHCDRVRRVGGSSRVGPRRASRTDAATTRPNGDCEIVRELKPHARNLAALKMRAQLLA
jgi:hypothetical protein